MIPYADAAETRCPACVSLPFGFFFLSSIIFGGDGALVLVLIRKFH
jgi:hypothetical protein